jgi:hypothetical protein
MMAAISGQKDVVAAGTELALGDQMINGPLMVKAKPANTGYIYLGNDGAAAVSSTTGIILAAGDVVVFDWVGNLGTILVDSSVNGEGVGWIALNV